MATCVRLAGVDWWRVGRGPHTCYGLHTGEEKSPDSLRECPIYITAHRVRYWWLGSRGRLVSVGWHVEVTTDRQRDSFDFDMKGREGLERAMRRGLQLLGKMRHEDRAAEIDNVKVCHTCAGPDDGHTCDACGSPLCWECRIRYTDGSEAECDRCMEKAEEERGEELREWIGQARRRIRFVVQARDLGVEMRYLRKGGGVDVRHAAHEMFHALCARAEPPWTSSRIHRAVTERYRGATLWSHEVMARIVERRVCLELGADPGDFDEWITMSGMEAIKYGLPHATPEATLRHAKTLEGSVQAAVHTRRVLQLAEPKEG